MRLYYKKLYEHDITHEVSITTNYVNCFLDSVDEFQLKGKVSGVEGIVSIKGKQGDPRFGGDFKSILSAENARENDIMVIAKPNRPLNPYVLSIVKPFDDGYSYMLSLINERDRHSEFCVDNEQLADKTTIITSANNTLFYGVPGSGKSYSVDEMTKGRPTKRVVFHPDYTNSDFIGQILPGLDNDGNLEYRFTPGPFTDTLLAALKDPFQHHYLIIEEINRGNAPAIFGEVFQLLDRNDSGESRYGIANNEVVKYLNSKLIDAGKAEITDIKIPGNLSILATMNTSDQNVFTIDTAFQRRWNMKYVKNNFDANKDANENIAGSKITWKVFGEIVNDVLADIFTGIGSAEDKGLGAFFAKKEEITNAEKFGEKVLKYLWDDAFKMDREAFFNIGEGHKKLQHFLEVFEKPSEVDGVKDDSLKQVIKPDIFEKMLSK